MAMMSLGKTVDVTRINEERGFTNPHIRFRRIRGRLVPIINKKRVGQDISSVGIGTAKVGLVAGSLGLAKRHKSIKKFSSSIDKKIMKFESKFSSGGIKFLGNNSISFKKRVASKGAIGASKVIRNIFKHSGKLGLLGIATGIFIKAGGDEVQARSPFGKDFFFTKDTAGRDS